MQMLDRILAALSDPTRRAMLDRLSQGPATAGDLGAPFDLTQPAVSHHIKVLEQAGLILRDRDGARRPCRLAPDGLTPVHDWLAQLRAGLERNYARLDDLLAEEPPKEGETP